MFIVDTIISCASCITEGAETLSTLNLMLDALSFRNTAQTIFSNAIKDAWLSSIGTMQVIMKFAFAPTLY
jgi:hypothetical protein